MKHDAHTDEPKVLVATQADTQQAPVILLVLAVSLVALLLNIGLSSGN